MRLRCTFSKSWRAWRSLAAPKGKPNQALHLTRPRPLFVVAPRASLLRVGRAAGQVSWAVRPQKAYGASSGPNGCGRPMVGLLFIAVGVLIFVGGSVSGRPSAVHDPKGYEEAVNAPKAGCLFIAIGLVILALSLRW